MASDESLHSRGARLRPSAPVLSVLALLSGSDWAAAPDTAPRQHEVTIEGMRYEPASLVVRPGDRVVWRNVDLVPHTVTAPGSFTSGAVASGASWAWRASARGHFRYGCDYHPTMQAEVDVQ